MPFGKYKNKSIDSIITDVSHSKWLLKQTWFNVKYPNEYEYFKSFFDGILKQTEKTMYFYCLTLSDGIGVKIGKTNDYAPKRLYDYVCTTHNYTRYIQKHPVDIKKSFVFKTNDLDIEKYLKNTLKHLRIGSLPELFNIDFECIKNEIFLISKENTSFFYYKKPLYDLVPYDTLRELREEFVIHLDKHPKFQIEYEKHLYSNGLIKNYEPNFLSENLN